MTALQEPETAEDMEGSTTDDRPGEHEPASTAARRRRRWPWLLGTLVVIAGVATAALWFDWVEIGDGVTEATAAPVEFNTAEVVVRDLVETEEVAGTLGYAAGDPVLNRLIGTVSTTAEAGATLGEGAVLFQVDNQPVVLLYGESPAYRRMADGDEGMDVLQLEEALVRLGYDPDENVTVDEEFTWRTENMVEDWQEDLGLEETGEIELGRVVFLPGPIRVGEPLQNAGDPVADGTPLLATTAESTVVTVELDTADQGLLETGDAVVVELPDGTETSAVVTSVGTIAKQSPDGTTSYFEVEIVLDDDSAADGLDEAPVTVTVVTDRAENVIAVPVAALVALAEGGYAVELDNGNGTSRLTAVEPGMYADGYVEVASDELSSGVLVVVP